MSHADDRRVDELLARAALAVSEAAYMPPVESVKAIAAHRARRARARVVAGVLAAVVAAGTTVVALDQDRAARPVAVAVGPSRVVPATSPPPAALLVEPESARWQVRRAAFDNQPSPRRDKV